MKRSIELDPVIKLFLSSKKLFFISIYEVYNKSSGSLGAGPARLSSSFPNSCHMFRQSFFIDQGLTNPPPPLLGLLLIAGTH